MRRGEQSLPTIRRVEAEVDKINTSNILPPGVRIEKIYDRTRADRRHDAHRAAQHAARHRADLLCAVAVPRRSAQRGHRRARPFLSRLFFAITILVLRGESANLLSVGAIDFGLVVDATVIMVENIFRHLRAGPARRGLGAESALPATAGLSGKLRTIFRAAVEVNQAIFFSAAIIIAGFVPLFTLSRRRRPHFRPDGARPTPMPSPAG